MKKKATKKCLAETVIKTFLEVYSIKAIWVWCKDRKMSQWNRTENPGTNLDIHRHLIFNRMGTEN